MFRKLVFFSSINSVGIPADQSRGRTQPIYEIVDSLLYLDISNTHLTYEKVYQVKLKQLHIRILYMKSEL